MGSLSNQRRGELLLLLLFAACLLTVRLSAVPPPWLDEGYKLNAVRTLAERGVYGTYTVRGYQRFDPGISTGPITIVPLALSFRLFGTGLLQARLVIAAFALMALVAFHGLARRLYGGAAATLICLGLLAAPDVSRVSFVSLGRQALGEMPALALTLAGFCLWYDSWRSGSRDTAIGAGVAFALALMAKMPGAFGLVPALFAVAVARSWSFAGERRRAFAAVGVALTLVAIWQTIEHFGRAAAIRGEELESLADGIRSNLLAGHFGAQLTRTGWRVAALLAAAPISVAWRRRASLRAGRLSDEEWMEVAIAATVAFAAIWFVAFSVGWVRYVFVPLVLALLLLGGAAWELFEAGTARRPRAARRLYVVAAVVLALVAAAGHGAELLRAPASAGAAEMAAYIGDHVPRDAVVETWEWELDALGPHWQYSHPHQRYLFEAIRQNATGEQLEIRDYDALAADPEFLVCGPFSDWTRIYDSIVPSFEPVVDFGKYRLYRRARGVAP